jgi:hypothetical protein
MTLPRQAIRACAIATLLVLALAPAAVFACDTGSGNSAPAAKSKQR